MTNPIAVQFDGATWARSGADLAGLANGFKGTVAFWLRTPATVRTGSNRIFANQGDRFHVTLLAGNLLRVHCQSTNATPSDALVLTTSELATSTNYAFLASWDVEGADPNNVHVYLNDVSDKSINTLSDAFPIAYVRVSTWGVGATQSGAFFLTGGLADLWVSMAEYFDFSVAANRRLFFTAQNCIVPKSGDGTVGGVTPTMFFSDPLASNWHENKGTGGAFTIQAGELTEASDQPCWQEDIDSQIEALAPNANLEATNLQDTAANQTVPLLLSDIQDDPDTPDGDWWTAVDPTLPTSARLGFPTPSNTLIGTQTYRLLLRKTTGIPHPEVASIAVFQGETEVGMANTGVEITSTVGQIVTITRQAEDYPDPSGANVEIEWTSDPGEGFA